jgi:ABC-type transport system substrate-binding protein
MSHAAWIWVLAGLIALGTPVPGRAQPGAAGTLVVGLVAEPVNLDPAQVTDLNSARVSRRIVETLVTFPEESTQIVPGLAESWTISKDGLTYTIYPLLHSSQWTPAGPNRALYKNTRLDEVLHQARMVTDQAKRAELYREAQRILVDDPPWIFVDHEIQIAAFSRRVQGFKLHPSFDLRVETISLR